MEQQCSMRIDLFPSSTFLNSVGQSNSEDVSLSMPGRTCQDVSVELAADGKTAPKAAMTGSSTSCIK